MGIKTCLYIFFSILIYFCDEFVCFIAFYIYNDIADIEQRKVKHCIVLGNIIIRSNHINSCVIAKSLWKEIDIISDCWGLKEITNKSITRFSCRK